MAIDLNVDKLINSFEGPNFFKWFILPFIIVLLTGYIIGAKFVYQDIQKGGYTYKKYDFECEKKNKLECSVHTDTKEFNKCVQHKNDARCSYTEEKTGIWAPIIAYTIVPLIIAVALAGLLYKILIYIKNPKVAASIFIIDGLFGNRK